MTERAVLGGGCFWCLEAVYQGFKGVRGVVSGYCGGDEKTANYSSVCAGVTDHAEVVAIEFDPDEISFEALLKVFFAIHDPTTINRQGNDQGPQYRSVIFYQSELQLKMARQVMAQVCAEAWWPGTMATELQPALTFFPAEAGHQDYYRRNASQPYCEYVVAPKIAKVRAGFEGLLKIEVAE